MKTPKCHYCHQRAPIYDGQGNVQWATDDFPSPYLICKCGVGPLYLSSTCHHSVSFMHLTSTCNHFCISHGTSTPGPNEWWYMAYGDTQHSPLLRISFLWSYNDFLHIWRPVSQTVISVMWHPYNLERPWKVRSPTLVAQAQSLCKVVVEHTAALR